MQTEEATRAAREEAGAMAGTVKEQVGEVAHDAKEQTLNAVDKMRSDVKDRANDEAGRVAQTLRATSQQLQAMAGTDGGGIAITLAQEGAQATERLAARLEGGGVDGVFADVRSYARRRPGSFLLGAAVTGFVVGRIARNLTGDTTDQSSEPPAIGAADAPGALG